MNWVDLIVLAVLGVSALLALMRGLVRELLGVGAWVAAGFFAAWAGPRLVGRFQAWLGSPDYATVAAWAASYFAAVLVLSMVSSMLANVVRMSVLGGLDRTLGMLFGLLRGALLVVFAYIAVGKFIPVQNWPPVVQHAATLPFAFAGAELLTGLLPDHLRPGVPPLPPGMHETIKAADLLRAIPQGRALARPKTGSGDTP